MWRFSRRADNGVLQIELVKAAIKSKTEEILNRGKNRSRNKKATELQKIVSYKKRLATLSLSVTILGGHGGHVQLGAASSLN
jgi:hypothetical protein